MQSAENNATMIAYKGDRAYKSCHRVSMFLLGLLEVGLVELLVWLVGLHILLLCVNWRSGGCDVRHALSR